MDKRQNAKELVERVAADPTIKSSYELGQAIGREVEKLGDDKELLQYVIEYMIQKAKEHGCGSADADHDCEIDH